jgi:hypothetical protein
MAKDFHEWAFESAGTNPLGWQQSAKDLLEAADAVKARVVDVFDGGMHSLAAVQAMLVGMALECLLKGMWIKKHKACLGALFVDRGEAYSRDILDSQSEQTTTVAKQCSFRYSSQKF